MGAGGLPKLAGVVEVYLQINLEPQFIHLSKSKLRLDDTVPYSPGSSHQSFPAERGRVG
jgi:hypothetical protein